MKYADTHIKLANFGRELFEKKTLDEGLPHIARYTKNVIQARRCSIYMHNQKESKIRTTLADGIEMINLESYKGIVGQTIRKKKPIIANDAYSHPDFFSQIDKETGYRTLNTITAPIFNSSRDIIGVLQLLNKDDGFDKEDEKLMMFFAYYVSSFLELINEYKIDMKQG